MKRFTGKVAVVTGAAKGLGRAIAERFIEEDIAGVAILDFDEATLANTAKELGDRAFAVKCDVSDINSVEAAFKAVVDKYGRIDILVNNAGVTGDAMLTKMTPEGWQRVINIDLNSVFYCTKQVLPLFKQQNYGRIINVSSLSAYGNIGQANYSAAKAGVLGLTRTTALEIARYNATANAICPCFINTDIIKTVPESVLKNLLKLVPLGRVGEPEEVSGVVAFLASADGGFVTGQDIKISGGA